MYGLRHGATSTDEVLPARKTGVCRAYIAKAIEYGLDAAIVNTSHRYCLVEPDLDLLEMVDAFAKIDGSP